MSLAVLGVFAALLLAGAFQAFRPREPLRDAVRGPSGPPWPAAARRADAAKR